MGKKISELFLVIAFFPIAIIFFIFKLLIKLINKKRISNFLSNITIESIDSLSGNEFEEFLYYLLTNIGLKVTKTKKSHDYGADLLVKINNQIIAVQCKLYNKHSVGNSAIQEIFTATNYYNADLGIVITNSYYSKPAISLAERTNIILWDRNNLIKLLNLNNSDKKYLKKYLITKINENQKIHYITTKDFKLSLINN